ncbi:MAG: hypothetical protein EBR30_27060 [Cytophagia bacterium]|nr:hypothetical protein [Cytophagia bacterium]
MRLITSIILLHVLTGCSKKTELSNEKVTKVDTVSVIDNNEFIEFLSTLDKVELPLTIKGCGDANAGKRILEKGKEASTDNSYFKSYHHPFGQISTNGNYSAIITFGLADCLIPELITFDRNGKQIDRKSIAIGYCGSDCGYSCSEFMMIDKEFILYTSDTIQSYECDSLRKETPRTAEHYVIYKKGKLKSDGQIELTEELRKELALK